MIFSDIVGACGWSGLCFARSDSMHPFSGRVTVNFLSLKQGKIVPAMPTSHRLSLGAGPAAIDFFCIVQECIPLKDVLKSTGCDANGTDCLLLVDVSDDSGLTITSNLSPLVAPANLSTPQTSVHVSVSPTVNPDGSVDITVASHPSTALFVVLTTQAPGRFSQNGFFVLPSSPVIIRFIPWEPLDISLLVSSLRVDHLGANL